MSYVAREGQDRHTWPLAALHPRSFLNPKGVKARFVLHDARSPNNRLAITGEHPSLKSLLGTRKLDCELYRELRHPNSSFHLILLTIAIRVIRTVDVAFPVHHQFEYAGTSAVVV